MKLTETSSTRRVVSMPLSEFMAKLGLPGRPVTVFASWDGKPDAVRIYLEGIPE